MSDTIIINPTVRTLYSDHSHKGANCDVVADVVDYMISFGNPKVFDDTEAHKSNSGKLHRLTVPFASSFKGEMDLILMLKDDMPRGAKQNNQSRWGGGGTQSAMEACDLGECQGVYANYAIASHGRLPHEKQGNLPAPLARIWTPDGKLIVIPGGELGASAFFRRGLRHVLEVLRAYDVAA